MSLTALPNLYLQDQDFKVAMYPALFNTSFAAINETDTKETINPHNISLHDFSISQKEGGDLSMEILAKTYRFKEGAELPKDTGEGKK